MSSSSVTGTNKHTVSLSSYNNLVKVGRSGITLDLVCVYTHTHTLSMSFLLPLRGSDQGKSILTCLSSWNDWIFFLKWKKKRNICYQTWVTLHCTFISLSPTWYWPFDQDSLKPNLKFRNTKHDISYAIKRGLELVWFFTIGLCFALDKANFFLVVWKEPVIPGFYIPHLYFLWENVLVKINASIHLSSLASIKLIDKP